MHNCSKCTCKYTMLHMYFLRLNMQIGCTVSSFWRCGSSLTQGGFKLLYKTVNMAKFMAGVTPQKWPLNTRLNYRWPKGTMSSTPSAKDKKASSFHRLVLSVMVTFLALKNSRVPKLPYLFKKHVSCSFLGKVVSIVVCSKLHTLRYA